jgi:hypothetical protein
LIMDTIRAIETHYAGYRMRSRLEARWAVFFDALAIPWQYELEGFHVGENCYLPDFWLPRLQLWAEVKPDLEAVKKNEALYAAFVRSINQPLLLLVGTPDLTTYSLMRPARRGVSIGKFDFCRWWKRHQVETAIFAARSARFGQNGRG